jgi:hypothetical protein
MKYFYFISFEHSGGVGRGQAVCTEPITRDAHLRNIELLLMEELKVNELTITNFILLRTE